jgi:hypothetical protein
VAALAQRNLITRDEAMGIALNERILRTCASACTRSPAGARTAWSSTTRSRSPRT